MSEPVTSSLTTNALIIVSEISVVLLVLIVAMLFFGFKKRKKNKTLAIEFLEDVKTNEVQREQALKKKIDESTSLDDSAKSTLVESIINAEKGTYLHVAKLFMGHKPDSLVDIESEIKNISENYISVIEEVAKNSTSNNDDGDGDNDAALRDLQKQVTSLRDEKKTLKEKNSQLQIDFDAAMESMERMTSEFANMYEGGSEGGEKRVKNEMYQLKQTLAQKKEFTEDGEGDSVPDMDVAEESAESPEITEDVDASDIDSLLDSSTGEDKASK